MPPLKSNDIVSITFYPSKVKLKAEKARLKEVLGLTEVLLSINAWQI